MHNTTSHTTHIIPCHTTVHLRCDEHPGLVPWSTLKPSFTDTLNNLSFNRLAKASTSSLKGWTPVITSRCHAPYLRSHDSFINQVNLVLYNGHDNVPNFLLHLPYIHTLSYHSNNELELSEPSFSSFQLQEMNFCRPWRMQAHIPVLLTAVPTYKCY